MPETIRVLTAQERWVLANLSQPRSARELSRLTGPDPYSPFDHVGPLEDTLADVDTALEGLIGEGFVSKLGVFDDAENVVRAVESDELVPTLHPKKAEQFIDRFNGRRAYKLREGDLYYWTETGRAELLP